MFFPLLLLYALRLEEERWRAARILGMIVAATWLTNAPSAVMVNYSLVLILVVLAVIRRSTSIFAPGSFAVGVGLALAAFYVLPATFEQKWVDISQVLGRESAPRRISCSPS